MGNQNQGAHNCGFIYIQTDQPVYYAGQTVTGQVYMNIIAPFPGNTIVLKIKGGEQVYWKQVRQIQEPINGAEPGQPTHKTIEKEVEHNGKTDFYKHKIILYQFMYAQFLPPGQYTFPFSFLLGKELPGTFLQTSDVKTSFYRCQVGYQVKAECESLNEVFQSIKHQQDLVIREPLKDIAKDLKGEMEVKPTLCCCFSQGQSKITCFFEKNFYLPGEQARMLAEIDNSDCSLPVTGVNCILQKHLTLQFQDGTTRQFINNINSFNFPGVGAKEKAVGETARSLNLPMGDSTKPMNPSTNAALVKCHYEILVVAQLDGCCLCCSPIPTVTAKVQIAPPPPPNYGIVQPPPNWNPQVFEVRNVVITNDYMYKGRKQGGGYVGAPPPPPPQPYGQPQNQMYNPSNNTSIDNSQVHIQMPLVPPPQYQENFGHHEEHKNYGGGSGGYVPPPIPGGMSKHGKNRMEMNDFLNNDEYLVSANQLFYARMQSDGNFVIYKTKEAHFASENAIWSSNTYLQGEGPFCLKVQQDGNLVVYDGRNQPTWASDTYGKGNQPYSLVMNMDGNLTLHGQNNHIIWASGTSGK